METKNIVITITWKNLNCELCKTALPFSVEANNQEYNLIGFENKYTRYIILEAFSKEKQPIGLHIINMAQTQNNKFLMGRGHHCDLKISDISVSRVHAFISYNKGRVYLEDNDSKFGTLVLRKDSIAFNDNNDSSVLIQKGRSLLKFTLNRPWLSFVPCIGSLFRSSTTTTAVSAPSHSTKIKQEELENDKLLTNSDYNEAATMSEKTLITARLSDT
jgi:hypothetical protein